MKVIKLAVALGLALAIILPGVGCSSSETEKNPKAAGVDPNARPIGRGAGGDAAPAQGAAKPGGGAQVQGGLTKD